MTERTIVLLRHSKADRPARTADIDRPLTARGHADAAAAGAWLLRRRLVPDAVICSPAKRTRQTWHGVALALGGCAPTISYEAPLYHGGPDELLNAVRAVADDATTVLVIGHNPAISQLSVLLDPNAALDSDGLRTSGIAVHTVTNPWPACAPGTAPLTATHTARG